MRVAEKVHPHLPALLTLARETGRRLSAILKLRAEDLRPERTARWPHGAAHWRAENDKKGLEGTVPLTAAARRALNRQVRRVGAIGGVWVFPDDADPSRPADRFAADLWLRGAERAAGLEPLDGSLWHAYRRMWVTRRKDLPAEDVAKAGGWKDVRTLHESYMRDDAQTTARVVLHEERELTRRG